LIASRIQCRMASRRARRSVNKSSTYAATVLRRSDLIKEIYLRLGCGDTAVNVRLCTSPAVTRASMIWRACAGRVGDDNRTKRSQLRRVVISSRPAQIRATLMASPASCASTSNRARIARPNPRFDLVVARNSKSSTPRSMFLRTRRNPATSRHSGTFRGRIKHAQIRDDVLLVISGQRRTRGRNIVDIRIEGQLRHGLLQQAGASPRCFGLRAYLIAARGRGRGACRCCADQGVGPEDHSGRHRYHASIVAITPVDRSRLASCVMCRAYPSRRGPIRFQGQAALRSARPKRAPAGRQRRCL
jgi:hypothetical protein